ARLALRARLEREDRLDASEGAARDCDPVGVDSGEPLQIVQCRQLVLQVDLLECDEPVRAAVVQRVDPRIARRAPVAAAMGDEENVAVIAEEPPQLGLPAGSLLAAVVVEDGAERAAARRLVDEPVKLELAARERNFFGLRGSRGRGNEVERERPANRALSLLQFGQ